jgi:hypothetical protein
VHAVGLNTPRMKRESLGGDWVGRWLAVGGGLTRLNTRADLE